MTTEENRAIYNANIARDYPHNLKVFVLFDLIWGMGIPFAGNSLIPAFMVVLGSSKTLIGLFSVLPMLLGVFQIITSHYFRTRPKKKWLSLTYSLTLLPWVIYSVIFFCFPQFCTNSVKLALFFAVQFVFWLGSGGNEGVRFSMLTQCTPLNNRGSLFGNRTAVQVAVSLLLWPVAVWVMHQWPEPRNFLGAFSIASFFFMISGPAYLLTREHQNPDIIENTVTSGLKGLLSSIRLLLKELLTNRHYRVFLLNSVILNSAVSICCFIVVFAKEQMHLSGSSIIRFTIIQMVGGALSSTILGKLADRLGYKIIGIMQSIPLSAGFMLAAFISSRDSVNNIAVYAAFFLCSSTIIVSRMVFMNLSVELMPRYNAGMLISLSNALISPLILIVVPLGGLVVDITGSYTTIFLAGAGMAIISGLVFAFYIHEPRKAKTLDFASAKL